MKKKILKDALKPIKYESMGDDDLKKYLPHVPIIKYSQFSNYKDINDILPNEESMMIYLIEDSPNNGHWCCLVKRNDEILNFDSYGNKIDSDLKWTPEEKRIELGVKDKYLSNILNNTDKCVKYNNIDYQAGLNDVATCGRHCIFFLTSGLSLEEYYKMMKRLKKHHKLTYDDIVSLYVQ